MADNIGDNKHSRDEAEAPPPQYGSQEYWDERYKKFRTGEPTKGDATEAEPKRGDDGATAYHAWYFTYKDLRPLLLPLILGGTNEALDPGVDDHSIDDEDNRQGQNSNCFLRVKPGLDEVSLEVTNPFGSNEERKDLMESVDCEEDEGEEEDDDEEEGKDLIESIYSEEEDDEDDEEELPCREGLTANGPISVLELGCGDVPLGDELSLDLKEIEKVKGAKPGHIAQRILCTDYSPTCIQILKDNLLKQQGETTQGDQHNGELKEQVLQYEVADARQMKHTNESFELILEKGTLDAMLSDIEVGTKNCVAVVSECARILKIGGYLLIVSHLNAHTSSGLEWLDNVVVVGLRAGGGIARWEIEVHGNDGDSESSSSPGPAVYIIRKKPPIDLESDEQKDDDDSAPATIPLRFFSY
jgi:SAM-dependent methyltransferase